MYLYRPSAATVISPELLRLNISFVPQAAAQVAQGHLLTFRCVFQSSQSEHLCTAAAATTFLGLQASSGGHQCLCLAGKVVAMTRNLSLDCWHMLQAPSQKLRCWSFRPKKQPVSSNSLPTRPATYPSPAPKPAAAALVSLNLYSLPLKCVRIALV